VSKAAYCSECNGYVWVAAGGGCSYGHARSYLRDLHVADALPSPVGVPPQPTEAPTDPQQHGALDHGFTSQGTPLSSQRIDPPPAHPVDPAGGPADAHTQPAGYEAYGDPVAGAAAEPSGYHMPPRAAVNASNTRNIGVRIVAYLIDLVILVVVQAFVGAAIGMVVGVTAAASGGDPEAAAESLAVQGTLWMLGLVITVGYFTVLEASLGWTPGKRAFGLRVVNDEAGSISWGQALARNLMRLVDLLFWGLPALISMQASELNQRLGDRVAKTYVIR
jgi:uncharacterized RDD family membrane protein YckC